MVLPEKTYPSKRDTWLVVVLVAAGLFSLWVAVSALLEEPGAGIAALAILLASAAFVIWMFTRTFYILTASDLVVHSGPFRWTVPLGSIRRVFPTKNPLSSPALSLDRLEIRHASGMIMISPEDKRRFLEDLVERTPGLVLDGDGAVRR